MLKYQKFSVRHLFYQVLFITYDGLNISRYINLGKCSRGVRLLGICENPAPQGVGDHREPLTEQSLRNNSKIEDVS